jgi:F-type H+-transporting ATPase subunit epsilon
MSLETKEWLAALQCDLVSAESSLFSGLVKFVSVKAAGGEIGIAAGHSPLLTSIPPGHLKIIDRQNREQFFFIEGGYLEVQPHAVTILTDTALRASDLDLQKALESKRHAEKMLAKSKSPRSLNFTKASHELLEAMAKIQVIDAYRKNKRQ